MGSAADLDLSTANVGSSPGECGSSHGATARYNATHEATSSLRISTPLGDWRPTLQARPRLAWALVGVLWPRTFCLGVDQHCCVHKDTLDRCAATPLRENVKSERKPAVQRGEKRTPERLSLREKKVVRIYGALLCGLCPFSDSVPKQPEKRGRKTRDGSLDPTGLLAPQTAKKTCLARVCIGRPVAAQSSTLQELS